MVNKRIHTLESCRIAAAEYPTRKQLKKLNRRVYHAAWANGWLDILYPPETRPTVAPAWTRERVAEVSQLYETRSAMLQGPHQWALKAARKNGWLDVLPPVKKQVRASGYWTFERCQLEASKHQVCRRFMKESMGGYQAAWRNGWLDQICSHMVDGSASDGDCFYLWRAIGAYFNGEPVYKFGVTSTRLKVTRIEEVARAGGLEYDLILWLPVTDAYAIERQVKTMGTSPQYTGFDGCTEFRAFTDDEVKQIKAIAVTESIP